MSKQSKAQLRADVRMWCKMTGFAETLKHLRSVAKADGRDVKLGQIRAELIAEGLDDECPFSEFELLRHG